MSKLVYNSPARRWNEALPLGNGKLAAMVFGGIRKERIAVNDATLWSGYPRDYRNPECEKALPEARRLVFEGKNADADRFVSEKMRGEYSESYLPLGELIVKTKSKRAGVYCKTLDLDCGALTVQNGGERRECFVSYPDGALYYRIRFSEPVDLVISAQSKLRAKAETERNDLFLTGFAPDRVVPNYVTGELRPIRYDEKKGMAFSLLCRADTDGSVVAARGKLCVKNAQTVCLTVMTETGFSRFDKAPSRDVCALKNALYERMSAAETDFDAAFLRHRKDYNAIFGRQKLELYGKESGVETLLSGVGTAENDRALVNLLYDYGKYLIVSGSRDSQPLNLQGQWNASVRPPWSGNLTVNINFQMNYWGAAACNLGDCLEPFYRAVAEIAESGEKTAAIDYGAKGFCCNHNVDLWRMTTPVKGNPAYMFAPLCGVWLANEAYASSATVNGAAESRIVKLTEAAAEFCLDFLTERDGELVTCPSSSPEAEFFVKPKRCALDYASAFDLGIVRQCFENCLAAGKNRALNEKIIETKHRLRGFTATDGVLNEWHDGRCAAEKGHRHFSPLYAVYPGSAVGENDPETFRAAKRLFDLRTGHARNKIGWSAAWAACLAARFGEGDRALGFLKSVLKRSLFKNLFAYHPPAYFQIDGNLGFVAAVNEMLCREVRGEIELLAACPAEWASGEITGHKACGAELGFAWKDGRVVSVEADIPVRVRRSRISENARLVNVVLV